MSQHEVIATLQDGMHFTVDTGDGQPPIPLDADPDVGGQDRGVRPLKLMLSSVAGCTSMDVISILRKKRQDVTGLQVKVAADQHTGGHPHLYTKLYVTYIVSGRNVDPAAVERAIELSTTKYCPAINLLRQIIPVETRYEIVEVVASS